MSLIKITPYQYPNNKLFFSLIRIIISILFFCSSELLFFKVTWAQSDPGWINLVTDPNAIFIVPVIPRPSYLQSITDPTFGTKVTRITGNPGTAIINKDSQTIGTWGNVARHWYSKAQPWNADESLIYLYFNEGGSPTGALLLDGQTYQPIKFLNLPNQRVRWHPTDPDLMIYAVNNEIGYFNVQTEQKTILRTFPDYTLSTWEMGEGNVSFNGKMVLLHGYKGGKLYVFAYDLQNDVVYPAKEVTSFIAFGGTWSCFDWAAISPKGDYILIYWHNTFQQVYDLNMNLITTLKYPTSHMDLGIDENGDEVAVGYTGGWWICGVRGAYEVYYNGENYNDIYNATDYVYGTHNAVVDKYKGQLTKQRLSDGAFTPLTTGNNYALSHTSMRNQLRPGWSYNWFPGSGTSVFKDEIIAVKTDGSYSVQRFAHLHNIKVDYYSEAHPCPSLDGRRVIIASNWSEVSGRPVGAYIVDARDLNYSPPPSPSPSPSCPATFNQVLVKWGQSCAGCNEDLMTDGKVNLLDLAVAIKNWNICH